MLGRIVHQMRRKLSVQASSDVRKASWPNLMKIHNERRMRSATGTGTGNKSASERGKLNGMQINHADVHDVNHHLLRVEEIIETANITDIANCFPSANTIIIEKSNRSGKLKTAHVGFESENDCIKAFLTGDEIQIREMKVLVTFDDVNFEKKYIKKEKKSSNAIVGQSNGISNGTTNNQVKVVTNNDAVNHVH